MLDAARERSEKSAGAAGWLAERQMETAGEVVEHAETCIVASRHAEVGRALEGADGRMIIDLVRLPDTAELARKAEYHGVAW